MNKPTCDPRLQEFDDGTIIDEIFARFDSAILAAIKNVSEEDGAAVIFGTGVDVAALMGILSDELRENDEMAYKAFIIALTERSLQPR